MSSSSLPAPVTDLAPGLHWAVKHSFLTYLSRLPDGRMSVSDGASQTDDDAVLWQPGPGDVAAGEGDQEGEDRVLTFVGDLRFGGHGGLLFVRLADPHVTVRGTAGELSVLDTFGQAGGARISLVTFRVSERLEAPGHEVISADQVQLTDDGAAVFNTVYAAGELFEPLTIVWPLHRPAEESLPLSDAAR